MEVKIKRLRPGTPEIPQYATKLSAGMDLRADLSFEAAVRTFNAASTNGPIVIMPPGSRALIPTGLAIELPDGYEAQVRSRSGLALTSGVAVLNSPGTIDADYRGEIGVILVNHGNKVFIVHPGDRIAQLVIAKVEQAALVEVQEIAETERSGGGFGSTGVK